MNRLIRKRLIHNRLLPTYFRACNQEWTALPDDEDCIHVSYNVLNLPQRALWYDDEYIDYSYLADGTKLSALNYDEEGYHYAGPFRFRSTEDETVLESVSAAGGRIVRREHPSAPATYEPRYFITDHLGSTRVVVDSLGTIVQQVDYLPYGEKCNNSTLISGENDYLYGGKEFYLQETSHLFTGYRHVAASPRTARPALPVRTRK